jgi:hypothetical protein
MIGMYPSGEAVQKLAGTALSPKRPKRLRAFNAPQENIEIRRDLAIAYLRLQQNWSVSDLAWTFHMTRHQIMAAVTWAEEFNRQEKTRRARSNA